MPLEIWDIKDEHACELCECCPAVFYGPPCEDCGEPTGLHCSWSQCEREYEPLPRPLTCL